MSHIKMTQARIAWCRDRGNAGLSLPAATALDAFDVGYLTAVAEPIEMLLFCPYCHVQHIDKIAPGWSNPPHATHTCGHCGLLWRPSNRNTTGVGSIPALEPKHVERIRAAYMHLQPDGVEIPVCSGHAQAWFCERNHLKGDHDCVICAFQGERK